MDDNFSKARIDQLPPVTITYHQAMALRQILHQAVIEMRLKGVSVAHIQHCRHYESVLDDKIKELLT